MLSKCFVTVNAHHFLRCHKNLKEENKNNRHIILGPEQNNLNLSLKMCLF